jgi:hypothetical protein
MEATLVPHQASRTVIDGEVDEDDGVALLQLGDRATHRAAHLLTTSFNLHYEGLAPTGEDTADSHIG